MKKTILSAKKMALKYHININRPNFSAEPSIIHLAEVASYVSDCTQDENIIASAWLHDILEDTPVTRKDIETEINKETMVLVDWLTDPSDWKGMEIGLRKSLQTQRIREAPKGERIVKLADQISNIRSVLIDPPVEWTFEKKKNYIEGAIMVSKACNGVVNRLDQTLLWYTSMFQKNLWLPTPNH